MYHNYHSDPLRKVPKYVYLTKYHRSSDPGLEHGYPDHDHLNPWN